MHWLLNIVENLALTVLILLGLAGGLYLLLLMLHGWLRFKSGRREQEGLSDLWRETLVKPKPEEKQARETENKQDLSR